MRAGFPARSRWSAAGRNVETPAQGGCFGNTDLEWVGCSLPWEEGEEAGHGFCVVRSRISREVWVSDFAWSRAAKVALERPALEVILQQANLPLDCFCPVGLFLGQPQHFVSLFITCQRRHHLQKSLGMRFHHCSLDFQSGDYALKLFL